MISAAIAICFVQNLQKKQKKIKKIYKIEYERQILLATLKERYYKRIKKKKERKLKVSRCSQGIGSCSENNLEQNLKRFQNG